MPDQISSAACAVTSVRDPSICSSSAERSWRRRFFTSRDAFAISCWNRRLGMSLRRPRCSARIELPSARCTRCRKPKSEKSGARVARNRADDALVAARHKHVRHHRIQDFSLGDRQQVRLTLGPGNVDQDAVVEALGMRQHRLGHLDGIVLGEFVDKTDRGSVGSRQTARELGSRDNFDFIGEPRNHVAKGGDVGSVVAAAQQQIDGVIQRPRAGLIGAPQNSFIKVLQWNSQRYQAPATHWLYSHQAINR